LSNVEKNQKWRVFIVSHTHWDREWYQTFQKFRAKLVRLVDNLLDILRQDSSFAHFTLDGQTVVLEDYLEAEPERREEIEGYVREGRILIGPWYVLPDEFLEGPEAIIRNLMLGYKIATGFGAVMRVGYLPDMFGHIGQMPQILNGFGLNYAAIWRGVDPKVKDIEFYWEAPDGSRVLAALLQHGYCYGANLPTDPEKFRKRINRIVDELSRHATTRNLLLMNGCDHLEAQPKLPALIKGFNKKSRNVELIHGTLPSYFEALRESVPPLRSHTGEFRSYGRAFLLPNVLSTRIWIKQWNHKCENLLERLAEPLVAWLWFVELDSSENQKRVKRLSSLCWLAWKYLIQNHPHDSICGCSIDRVHKDMKFRFKAVEEISEEVVNESAEAIAEHIRTEDLPPSRSAEKYVLVVFNPDYGPRTDCARARLEFGERPMGLHVRDSSGKVLSCQIIDIQEEECYRMTLRRDRFETILPGIKGGNLWRQVLKGGRISIKDKKAYIHLVLAERGKPNIEMARRLHEKCRRLLENVEIEKFEIRAVRILVDFVFVAEEVPAYGYKTYLVEPTIDEHKTVSSGFQGIENEFFKVEVDPELGTISIYDKENDLFFEGCNHFVDGGDAGDEYNYSPPHFDNLVSRPYHPPTVVLIEDGPVMSTLRVDMVYKLPVGLSEDRASRSKKTKDFPISSYVTSYRSVRRVEFRTVVDNKVDDHRLRVIFPTNLRVDRVHAEGHFDVLERPVGAPPFREELNEQPLGTRPQRSFVDVSDGERGLMVSNRGLPEYEALPGEGGVKVALTLLRSVGWLARMDFKTRNRVAGPIIKTPEAQCKGERRFEYAVIPYRGGWEQAYKEAHYFNNPLWIFGTDIHDGILPLEQSWVKVEPPSLVISAIKVAENGKGVVIRLYNITDREVEGKVKPYKAYSKAYLLNLNEEPIGDLEKGRDGWLNIKVGKKRILTIRLDP